MPKSSAYLQNNLQAASRKDSAVNAFVITPHDTDEIFAQALLLSADATLSVVLALDEDPVSLTLTGGIIHPIAVKKVRASGTDGGITITGLL